MSTLGARRFPAWIPPALAALLFALLSLAMLPYPGLQDDEVFFTVPLYQPEGTLYSVKLFGHRIPLMLLSYLGGFKTWLYAGIMECFSPSAWSVRVPMVLTGVITICLTWMWTRRAAGTRAAIFTVALLSTDAMFIVTNTFDWGPVVFQHVFLMGGLLAVQIWLDDVPANPKWLAVGFFLWGLGLWDKALLIWPLIGLAVATLCVYPKELRRHLRPAPVAIATLSLLLGALPLVSYNIVRRGETASTNTKIEIRQIPLKVEELERTLDGSVLLGPIVATAAGPIEQTPKTLLERLSLTLKERLGAYPHNWMLPALALSFVFLVLLLRTPRFRILLFILITAAVTWLQMAANTGTGGGAHHVILLWPFPCIFVGVALAGAADRTPKWISHAIVALVTLIVGANLLNTNEYLADMVANGTVGGWTDAIYRLAGAVYPYRAGQIGIVDWGYLNPLRMLYDGDLRLTVVSDFIRKPVMTDEDRARVFAMISSPHFIFVQHTDDNQIFPGVNDELRSVALAEGYAEQVERTVHDDQGRPVYEILRFVKTR